MFDKKLSNQIDLATWKIDNTRGIVRWFWAIRLKLLERRIP